MTTLEFDNVSKYFGTAVALEGFSLSVAAGEFVSLLGPSGCGKTTALRIAAGFETPSSGVVTIDGRNVGPTPAHRRNIGMVFQGYSLFPNLTVAGNVEYGLRTRRVERAERRRRMAEALELVELGSFADRYPHQLSGGQQQRVALARAIAVRPSVLLLDEPLSALDAKVRASLRDEIRRIQIEVGITTLFVTHDQEEALGLSDRVGVMSNGRLDQFATPHEIYQAPATAFVARFVGAMNEFVGSVTSHGSVDLRGCEVPLPMSAPVSIGASDIRLLVRPEDCSVRAETVESPSGSATIGRLVGSVVSVTFQGASTIITVRLDRSDALVSSSMVSRSAPSVTVGERVLVEFETARAVVETVA